MVHTQVVNALAHFNGPTPIRGVMQRLQSLNIELEQSQVAYELRCAVEIGTVQTLGEKRGRKYLLK